MMITALQIARQDIQPGEGMSVAELKNLVGGKVLPITRWGEPVMHEQTVPVTVFDEALHTFLADMFATMAAADGVGLAATQVGDNRSIFVFRCPDGEDIIHMGAIMNPVVILPDGKDRKLVSEEEGCLSLPGAYATLSRPDHSVCRGLDLNGDEIEVLGTGLLARCLQHETDHLSGMVFGDRLSARTRKQLYADHEALAYRYPADWPVSPKGEYNPSR